MHIEVNNTSLFYIKRGNGSPLIMVHGNGETHRIFDKAILLLQKHFTVYALDTRGHGASTAVSEYHYSDMAEDIRCFIEKLNLEKPVFYGFSDGGIIGLLLAIEHPDLLSRLIISGANTRPEGIRAGWLGFFKVLNHFVHEAKMAMMLEEPHITQDMLQGINIPVYVLAGSHDMVKRQDTEFIAASIPGSRLKIVDGAGHGSYIVHNEKIARLILSACKL